MTTRVIQVIETDLFTRGCGANDHYDCRIETPGHIHEPIRAVTAYYSLDGQLLAERDPWSPKEKEKQ
jgi:hypothetical protein